MTETQDESFKKDIREVFNLLRGHEKDISKTKSELNTHCEVAKLRDQKFENDISYNKTKLSELEDLIEVKFKEIDVYITSQKAQKTGADKLRGLLKWAFGIILAIVVIGEKIWIWLGGILAARSN